jgi:predicted small secreted protein
MRKTLSITIALLIAATLLVACGGGGGSDAQAVEAGKALFAQTVIEVIVGPSLAGIGSRHDAAYIRESILDPNAVLVEGFPADTMPNVWGTELSGEQIDELVAYLQTLK